MLLDGQAAKGQYGFDASTLSTPKFYVFQVLNTESLQTARPMTIESILIAETDGDGKVVAKPAFSCSAGGVACSDAKFRPIIPDGYTADCVPKDAVKSEEIILKYDPTGVTGLRKAFVRIRVAGDPDYNDKSFDMLFQTAEGQARISCTPEVVDFGQMAAGQSATEKIECRSIGTSPLVITKVELLSKENPPLTVGLSTKWILSKAEPYEGKPELKIGPGAVLAMAATLTKVPDDAPIGATMHIYSNDSSRDKAIVRLFANSTGACFTVKPSLHDFGDVAVGSIGQREIQLKGCGSEKAVVHTIALQKGTHPDLSLDFTSIGGKAPTAEAPLEVYPNATQSFTVLCKPSALGNDIKGAVEIEDTLGNKRSVTLTCKPAKLGKPTACIDVKPSTTVIPQTPLNLSAACSKPPPGKQLVKYKWSVLQPQGSVAVLSNNASPTPALVPNVAGDYKFTLVVTDDAGVESPPAHIDVHVLPDNKLHIELTWVQAGDKDKTDNKGSDLDLHLAHPLAPKVKGQKDFDLDGKPDPWYAQCYDCYNLNCKPGGQPQWGDPADFSDNPTVDLDDTDGWGPENISIKSPQKKIDGSDAWYWIGVYAFNDVAMGPSIPKVRVFLDSTEVFNKKGPEMVTKDMWCVGKVRWDGAPSSTDVKPCFPNGEGTELRKKYPFLVNTDFKCPPPM